MTERETCERIVADGDCGGVYCVNCPLFDGDWDCLDLDVVTLAEMWLRLHPCEKKLVFSKKKLYADADITSEMIEMAREVGWPDACDGKNKEEIEELGLVVHPDWMEEIR